jgi:hypothetical protein
MSSAIMNNNSGKYSLTQIRAIASSNFKYEMSQDAITLINYLTGQIGHQTTPINPVYERKPKKSESTYEEYEQPIRKKKGNNRATESTEDWESLRSFQPTKIEQKTGIDALIGQIRLNMNKINDKSFLTMREQIISNIEEVIEQEKDPTILTEKIGTIIYGIASANMFYSKIYSDLFAELVTKYEWIRPVFDENFVKFVESFKNIEYVDPNANYDGFCDMNKHMVIRKANSQFFVNLALNGFIPKSNVLQILVEMLNIVADLIDKPNKSDEVNELTENIAILFNKEIWYGSTEIIGGLSLIDFVRKIATSKSKDYKSLPSRVIFKYMDLLEM